MKEYHCDFVIVVLLLLKNLLGYCDHNHRFRNNKNISVGKKAYFAAKNLAVNFRVSPFSKTDSINTDA